MLFNKDKLNELIGLMYQDIDNLNIQMIQNSTNDINYDYIHKKLYDIVKNILVVHSSLKNIDKKDQEKIREDLNYISKSLAILNEYNSYYIGLKNERSIKLLTIVNTIFLPLGFLVGYFGMNFSTMGVKNNKFGIYSIKHSQKYLWGGFLILVIVVLLLFNYSYI